jgi:hypothetical protein
MNDLLRTLFRIRKPRRALPSGPIPKIGTSVVRRGVKMTVTATIEPELWDWMVLSGWRIVTIDPDRRSCVILPADALGQLIAAGTEDRERVHVRLLSAASKRR